MWGFQQSFQWWMLFFGMGMMLFVIVIVGFVVWSVARLTTDSRDHPDTIDTPG